MVCKLFLCENAVSCPAVLKSSELVLPPYELVLPPYVTVLLSPSFSRFEMFIWSWFAVLIFRSVLAGVNGCTKKWIVKRQSF